MMSRLISTVLAAAILFSMCACSKKTSANEMKLVKTEGSAHVSDENRVEQKIRENMNLYTGYGIGTEESSLAWINLDSAKLLTLNESSEAVLEKDGRKLRVVLQSGDMFFCVLEDLGDDESLTLETGNMSMAIRGTCGVYRAVSEQQSQLVLLEGEVSIADSSGEVEHTASTGQAIDLYVETDGSVTVSTRSVTNGDVPDYVIQAIQENDDIREKILSGGGTADYMTEAQMMEIYGGVISCLQKMLAGTIDIHSNDSFLQYYWDLDNIVSYNLADCPHYSGLDAHGFTAENPAALQNWRYAFLDINADGFPELLISDSTLEDGYGIRDCWTTDGTQALHVTSARDNDWLELAANGYLVRHSAAILEQWEYYTVEPYAYAAYAERSENPFPDFGGAWNHWTVTDRVQDTTLLDTMEEAEYLAFLQANFPPIADTSLTWRPLS